MSDLYLDELTLLTSDPADNDLALVWDASAASDPVRSKRITLSALRDWILKTSGVSRLGRVNYTSSHTDKPFDTGLNLVSPADSALFIFEAYNTTQKQFSVTFPFTGERWKGLDAVAVGATVTSSTDAIYTDIYGAGSNNYFDERIGIMRSSSSDILFWHGEAISYANADDIVFSLFRL